ETRQLDDADRPRSRPRLEERICARHPLTFTHGAFHCAVRRCRSQRMRITRRTENVDRVRSRVEERLHLRVDSARSALDPTDSTFAHHVPPYRTGPIRTSEGVDRPLGIRAAPLLPRLVDPGLDDTVA